MSFSWKSSGNARVRRTFRPWLEILEDRHAPAVHVWDGGGVLTTWSDAGNWDAAGPPAVGETNVDLVFDGALKTTNQNDIAGLTIRSISFNTSFFLISGQAITLTGNIGASNAIDSNNIQLNIKLVGTVTVSHADVTTPPIILSGVLSGMGGLTLKGPGQLILQGTSANTYTGATRVDAGTLNL